MLRGESSYTARNPSHTLARCVGSPDRLRTESGAANPWEYMRDVATEPNQLVSTPTARRGTLHRCTLGERSALCPRRLALSLQVWLRTSCVSLPRRVNKNLVSARSQGTPVLLQDPPRGYPFARSTFGVAHDVPQRHQDVYILNTCLVALPLRAVDKSSLWALVWGREEVSLPASPRPPSPREILAPSGHPSWRFECTAHTALLPGSPSRAPFRLVSDAVCDGQPSEELSSRTCTNSVSESRCASSSSKNLCVPCLLRQELLHGRIGSSDKPSQYTDPSAPFVFLSVLPSSGS